MALLHPAEVVEHGKPAKPYGRQSGNHHHGWGARPLDNIHSGVFPSRL